MKESRVASSYQTIQITGHCDTSLVRRYLTISRISRHVINVGNGDSLSCKLLIQFYIRDICEFNTCHNEF